MSSEFDDAYDAVVAQWGVAVRRTVVDGPLARTRVLLAGAATAPPLLCLPGGGGTAAVWFAQAADLAQRFRVIAPDLPGDAGATERRAFRSRADWPAWVDEVLDGVGAPSAAVLAHSYGAQIAVAHALARQERVRTLTLLDPTDVFARIRPSVLVRALPGLVAPSSARQRAHALWETRGQWPPTSEAGRLAAAVADGPRPTYWPPRRPAAAALDALESVAGGVTVVVGLRSRYHDGPALARAVGQRYPWMRVETLPVAHHELPFAYRP
ncbi:alpha/beta hydrolase [Tsukamurella asaccharolytica]|uniref:Alpha/beta hydrolase n=1 Tax=Tsukamurella asaccharolytica TaxID=2592067 RepID=A0A5C5RAL3_9ACTN|nr:alpha/beta fold hydrolase [Tsukamurella asaccharolytica]TWS20147.1 alpha/beta hydrolase [Tsukamurella asaccharolytica]